MKDIHCYLTFDGNARDAMTFYAKCLGADLNLMTFAESKMPCPDSAKDKIMHARLAKGNATLMASDTMPGKPLQKGNNFSVSVNCDTSQECEKIFNALASGAKITMPLQETFFAAKFGMLTDKYGVDWMFNMDKQK